MTQPEARLSRKIMNAVRAHGSFCFKVHGSEHMMAGLPDIIVCGDGAFIGLETKLPHSRDNVSERQKYVHQLIGESGGYVYVVTSVDEALEAIADALADSAKPKKRRRAFIQT